MPEAIATANKDSVRVTLALEFDEPTLVAGVPAIPDVIHVIPTGKWEHPSYGLIEITLADIKQFADNFAAQIRKGVFITLGHEGPTEQPAAGWFKELFVRADGLWGQVDWNNLGKQALTDKQFKYFSPEFFQIYEDPQTHAVTSNVLTGGALTKAPYFKELAAVVFAEPKSPNNNSMNIKDILAKKKSELTAEEKDFLKKNASELDEAQKTEYADVVGEPDADDAAKKKAAAKKAADDLAAGLTGADPILVQITASELDALKRKANEGAQAAVDLRAMKMSTEVGAMVFSSANRAGRFVSKQKEGLQAFMETLNDKQVAQFKELISAMPATVITASELGDGGAKDGKGVAAEVEALTNKKMTEGKMKYSDALKAVFTENAGLQDRYDAELEGR